MDSFRIQKWVSSLCSPPEIESQVWFVTVFYGKISHAHCLVMPDCLVTLWTIAHQAPLSMAFSRQEYWSGLPFSSGDLPDPGIEPRSLILQADSLPSELPGKQCVSVYSKEMT